MAIFKCKMCGGDLEIIEGVTVTECDYCGTKQTVPKVLDENLQNLFNRANTLRRKSEFDKAAELYEKIVESDSTQAEAYWGLILCKYGIEYVDDPATFRKIPTCHRASYDSIIADDDYKAALEYADAAQRSVYEAQAKEIDEIQKEILALAQNEEKYDVFICYKETDANGSRTQDSVTANDIYYQLTNEGFKVFYAAITLEGKLGKEYEPIIFAALNSAKVMLVVGSKPEYFNAVWVKNEWSRFLKIMKKDRSKLLIPCYAKMDAYDLPEEFAHLQAQDMGKIGFINDIIRGIKKVIVKEVPQVSAYTREYISPSSNISPLLKRASLFLEDGQFNEADTYAEKVLDQDPECAEAYLIKLMAEFQIDCKENLKNASVPFNNSYNYKKILRFADDKLIDFLSDCINQITLRNTYAHLARALNLGRNKLIKQGKNAENAKLRLEEARRVEASRIAEEERLQQERLEKEAKAESARISYELPNAQKELAEERLRKEKEAEQQHIEAERRMLFNNKMDIMERLSALESEKTTLIIKSTNQQDGLDDLKRLRKLKSYANITQILNALVFACAFSMSYISNMAIDIMPFAGIMIVFFLGALIFAGMMFKANKKSVAWVLLAYITAGIFSIIYATKVSKKCKIDILKHDENRKQLNIELASVDNAINNTRQALRAAEQKLADFERINRL